MTHLLGLLALAACSPGGSGGDDYFTGDWSCEHEPWDWYADPVQMALEADEDGEFDFDPPGALVTRRAGLYDFASGDLEYETSYLDGYYGIGGQTEGYGTIYDDGDVDLLYLSLAEDVLGGVTATRVRQERSGCTGTTSTWDVEPDADLDATPDGEPFTWTLEIVSDDEVRRTASWSEDGEDWSAEGSATSDLVNVLHSETSDGSTVVDTTSYDDGTFTSTQERHDGDFDIYYQVEGYLDGGRDVAFEGYEAGGGELVQECAYSVTYAGDGLGECTFYQGGSSLTCELEFDPDSCTYRCEDGNDYDCG